MTQPRRLDDDGRIEQDDWRTDAMIERYIQETAKSDSLRLGVKLQPEPLTEFVTLPRTELDALRAELAEYRRISCRMCKAAIGK